MKMKVHDTRFLTIVILSLLVFAMTSALCSAQQWSRLDRSQIYGIFQTMNGDKSTVKPDEIKVEVHDTDVYGIGLGYDFTEKWNLNTDFLFGTINTTGAPEGAKEEIKLSPSLFIWDVNLDYNFWKHRFSPLLTGGIGCFYFSGDDYDEADFSYNLGAGLRWDARDYLFIKAIYRLTWTKMVDTEDRILLDGISLGIGYMY